LKFRVAIDGRNCTLDLRKEGDRVNYLLSGEIEDAGLASVSQVSPGVFSILFENTNRSLTVAITKKEDSWEAYAGSRRYLVAAFDTRDKAGTQRGSARVGSLEIRAHMPGKVVRILLAEGSPVQAGQGIMVVEAMKMQNEVKAPQDGFIKRLHVPEGATVSAGQSLVLIESADQ
jgi:biotin carboxyl carrier protein